MVPDETQEILEDLEVAFGELSVPPDDRIVYDNSGNHLECAQIQRKFRGRHWRSLSIADLVGEADSLAFLTPEAFRFFLPAFVRASLLDPERADLIPDSILSNLADIQGQVDQEPPEVPTRGLGASADKLVSELTAATETGEDERRQVRRQLLSAEQKRALKRFISFLRENRPDEFVDGELDCVEDALNS